MLKRFSIILFLLLFVLIRPAFADSTPGDVIITLGEDLTAEQKQAILTEMGSPNNPQIVTVTNDEEHKYLGKYISKAQIGSKALSSSKITVQAQQAGLSVQTKNINWVTKAMYTNALITAGVKDADIYITAPFAVSGTAALTGIIKAYEISSDTVIPENQKQVANEEMVKSAKLADSIGADKATELIRRIKEEISKANIKTDADLRALIEQLATELGVQLSDAEITGLVDLFKRMQSLNIDWNQVQEQMQVAKEKITTFIQTEEGQNLLDKAKQFFQALFDALFNLLQGNKA